MAFTMDNAFEESSKLNSGRPNFPHEVKDTGVAGGIGLTTQDESGNFTVSRETRDLLIEQAREMRKHPTNAEASLWRVLRKKKFAGYRFRRQHPIALFIVDFYCPLKKLVIEIDGPIHRYQKGYDETREEVLKAMGCTVLRFTNQQVETDLGAILQEIFKTLSK
jgi:very-short-patch-repair endonuclease